MRKRYSSSIPALGWNLANVRKFVKSQTKSTFRSEEGQSIWSKRQQGSNPDFLKLVSENYLFFLWEVGLAGQMFNHLAIAMCLAGNVCI